MNVNTWIRQSHRWLSISCTLMVLANFAVIGRGDVSLWVGALTLVPLSLLLFSGLYLFVLPYFARLRRAWRVSS